MERIGEDNGAIIIGAGITGIGAAFYLREQGMPYVVLEQSGAVGGIWNTQRWHGARCDSDFVKYSFSFRPFLSERCLEDRAQIQAYLRSVAEEFGILQNTRFETRVLAASFDSVQKKWLVHTTRGTFAARFLINGNGYFSQPHVPAFKDREKFRGEIVHTFDLDAGRSFAGKRVVLVGSGSTAVCCAPALARVAKSLVLLQRSPSYIYEIDNRATPFMRLCQALYRRGFALPLTALRAWLQLRDDLIFVGFRRLPRLARWYFRRHWLAAVGEDAVRRHFTPRYDPWEQRIPIAVGLKAALRSGQVGVRTGAIERFASNGIVLTDGRTIRCDVCVLATGFELDFLKFDLRVDGVKIGLEGRNFYKGIMLGGVPNYFQPVGVWHSAWTQRSEAATRYAVRIMAHMAEQGFRSVAVERREVRYTPAITPNYILRSLPAMPRLYGTRELPSIDNLLSYRFNPAAFTFC